ncbi:hypothetical protein RS86_00508 [Microbacterium azadirachtae]|uniref:Uncharacterized protein n=1 Tax=Microbacterium azadirachtae TaxID=582680 RepID=A0A0F0LTB4_9MICO|nr:hypothetical protein RS86_00508 [Microbacterium azadirachtae]
MLHRRMHVSQNAAEIDHRIHIEAPKAWEQTPHGSRSSSPWRSHELRDTTASLAIASGGHVMAVYRTLRHEPAAPR